MENLQHSIESSQLQDKTIYAHSWLMRHIESHHNFSLLPEGYFIQAANQQAIWSEYIDKGCRGGWTEHNSTTLDDTPYRITKISYTSRSGLEVEIDDRKRKMTLDFAINDLNSRDESEDRSVIRFLQKSTPNQPTFPLGGVVESLLLDDSFVRIVDISKIIGESTKITAKPTNPFENPHSIKRPDDRLDSISLYTINGLEAMQSEEGALLRLSLDMFGGRTTTEWIPLNTLDFYQSTVNTGEANFQKLTKSLGRLILLNNTVEPSDPALDSAEEDVRALLQGMQKPIHYRPVEGSSERFRKFIPVARFSTDKNVQLSTPELVEYRPYPVGIPYLPVRGIFRQHKTLWATDSARGIATPLLYERFRKAPTYDTAYKHLADLITD